MIWLIPPDAWKKNRDRIVRRAARHMVLTQTNPGPDADKLRYDYVVTRAELAAMIEDIMRDTERLAIFYAAKKKEP